MKMDDSYATSEAMEKEDTRKEKVKEKEKDNPFNALATTVEKLYTEALIAGPVEKARAKVKVTS